MRAQQQTMAERFHALHRDGLLILANAWDAGSARLIETLGAKAIATSSAAVAWSHGYPDGDALPVSLLAATATSITRVIEIPLTVDVEGGYSSDPVAVGDAVARVVEAGAVGINIEDGTGSVDLLCAKIERAKAAGAAHGVNLFVNARTDVYLFGLAPDERKVAETIARAERYRAAGADGIFVPGLANAADIQAITSAVSLPVNIMARPGVPAATALATLGVRRLSAGAAIAEVLAGKITQLAGAFLRDGVSETVTEGAMPYPEINSLMLAG